MGTLVDEFGVLLETGATAGSETGADCVQLFKVVGTADIGLHALNGDTVDDTLLATAWIGLGTAPPTLPGQPGKFNAPTHSTAGAMGDQFYWRFYNAPASDIGSIHTIFGDSVVYEIETQAQLVSLLATSDVPALATSIIAIPEPASLGLMGLASIGIIGIRRRFRC